MDSSKVKDKDSKISFLKKLIAHVENELGVAIDLNPGKVVAGLEADKTRHFFQLFVLAATKPKQLDSEEQITLDLNKKANSNTTMEKDKGRADKEMDLRDTKDIIDPPDSQELKEEETRAESLANNDQGIRPESPTKSKDERDSHQGIVQREDMHPETKDEASVSSREAKEYKSHHDSGDSSFPHGHSVSQKDDMNPETQTSVQNVKEYQQSAEEAALPKRASPPGDLLSNDEKKSKAQKNESIRTIFFGAEDSEVDEDHGELRVRPRTARRRPPKVKDSDSEDRRQLSHPSKGEKPFIFRDKDESDADILEEDGKKGEPPNTLNGDCGR